MVYFKHTLITVITALILSAPVFSQLPRKRAAPVVEGPVEEIFLAGSLIGMSTVEQLPKGNLNSMVMHNFGLISGGIDTFYGIDAGAVVRLGIDYGLTERLSVGIGRTSEENNVDFRVKYSLLHQLKNDKVPVEIALKGDLGIHTRKENRFDYSLTERLNYLGSVMIARKFNDKLSLQVAPMIAHFNTVILEGNADQKYHTFYSVGLGGRYKLSRRNALTFEYLPVLGNRNSETHDHAAIGIEIDTGGHVFQIFAMSGRWFTEQHLLSRTSADASALDFRLGFNINRIFGL